MNSPCFCLPRQLRSIETDGFLGIPLGNQASKIQHHVEIQYANESGNPERNISCVSFSISPKLDTGLEGSEMASTILQLPSNHRRARSGYSGSSFVIMALGRLR